MAKAKVKRIRKAHVPVTPPQTVSEVLLGACMADITNEHAAAYASGIYRKDEMTEAERKKFAEGVFLFAALGWTYWNDKKEGKGS